MSAACADEPSAAAQAPPRRPPNPDQVVAEVGGRKITLKDVDAKWEEFDAAERARVTQLLYQNRRNMLDQLIGDILIENAAKAAGQSVDAYLAAGSAQARCRRSPRPTSSQFYEQNKDRAQGRTLEQLRGADQATSSTSAARAAGARACWSRT